MNLPSRDSSRGPLAFASQQGATLPRFLIALCVVQFLALATLWLTRTPKSAFNLPPPATNSATEAYFAGRPGPWGELEYIRIQIEPTDDMADAELARALAAPTRWFFAERTPEQVASLLRSLGLTEAQVADANRNPWLADAEGVIVEPPHEVVFGLSEETRVRLYAELAQNELNELYAWPFTYRQGGIDEWMTDSGLAPATLALVKQVMFQRGSAVCVSDLPALCASIPDSQEQRRLVKTLSRSAALLMKVRVRAHTDTAALANYWGRGAHVKDVERLLASLTKVPGGITLDVVHLLPPFARKRMNSYPTPVPPDQPAPDCYWSAWNFFNDPPDDRYYDDEIWRREIVEKCQAVTTPMFGDLVFLCKPDGVPIHSAVFIADDVVFTKNGANPRQPWKLMKLDDMLARYASDVELRLAYFRPPVTGTEGNLEQ